MVDNILLVFLVVAGILLIKGLLPSKTNKLGIEGKLIWIDKGNKTRAFINSSFEVLGKPDFMFKQNTGILAVEYKNRKTNIYASDIIQAKTAALAARGSGFKVTRVLVKTNTNEKYIDLPSSNSELFKQIEPYIAIARQARNGVEMKATPSKFKCKSCAFKQTCRFKYAAR